MAADKQERVNKIKLAVERFHQCSANHFRSEHVKEQFHGKVLWEGDVEVFDISGLSDKAKRCFAWSYGEPEEFMSVLELPPVDSPQAAVKFWVACNGGPIEPKRSKPTPVQLRKRNP